MTKEYLAVAYYRVSTVDQSIENQRLAINEYADAKGYRIVREYKDEAVSGSVPPLKREGFKKLIEDLTSQKVNPDVILVYEVSRIGRTLRESLDAIWNVEKYAPIIPVSSRESWLQTLDRSIRDLVLTVMAWAAERERDLLIERTKEGIKRARKMGKRIGRPKKKLSKRDVEKYLRKGVPKSAIAKILGISRTTLYERLKEWDLDSQ
jgi:DNA invertase Pin-like site-specific DNA recombinase